MRNQLLLGLLLTCAPAAAQEGIAVSESFVLRAQLTPGASAAASSESMSSKALAAELASGSAASQTFALHATAAVTTGAMNPIPPLVLAVTPSSGSKQGGDTVLLEGVSLAAAGSLNAQVSFAGTPSASVTELSGTRLQAVAPAGASSLFSLSGQPMEGNPLGRVSVGVSHALGADSLAQAYTYLPALVQVDAAQVGGQLALELRAEEPGFLGFLALGLGPEMPGLGLAIPPLSGALELLTGALPLGSLTPSLAEDSLSYLLPLPEDPALVGAELRLQAALLHGLAPLSGEFTNVATVKVQP